MKKEGEEMVMVDAMTVMVAVEGEEERRRGGEEEEKKKRKMKKSKL